MMASFFDAASKFGITNPLMEQTNQLIRGEHKKRPAGPVKGWEPGGFLDTANKNYVEEQSQPARFTTPMNEQWAPTDPLGLGAVAQGAANQFSEWEQQQKEKESPFTAPEEREKDQPATMQASQDVPPTLVSAQYDQPIPGSTQAMDQRLGLDRRFGYDEHGLPNLPAQEDLRNDTFISGLGAFGIGTKANDVVEPGRVAMKSAQGKAAPLYAAPDDPDFDNYANPVSAFSLDNMAINRTVQGLRSNWAADEAEWGYKLKGSDKVYDKEEVDNAPAGFGLPDGTFVSYEDMANAEFDNVQLVDDPSQANYIDPETGAAMSIDNVIIGGKPVSYEDFSAMQGGYLQLSDGTVLSPEQTKDVTAGGDLELVQTDLGFGNINKVNPDSPLENPADILPWLSDVALGSLPYFIPVWNVLTGASEFDVARRGYDPSTFDPETYTFEDKDMTNGQWVGSMASPVVNYATEFMGVGPAMRYAKHLQGMKPAARAGIAAAQEGLEEPLSSLTDRLASDGFENYGADRVYNPETHEEEFADTDFWGRAANAGHDMGEGFIAGALLGGGMSGAKEAKSAIKNKISGRGNAKRSAQSGGVDKEHGNRLDALEFLRKQQDEEREAQKAEEE